MNSNDKLTAAVVARVTLMEQYMDAVAAALQQQRPLSAVEQAMLRILADYQSSGHWLQDYGRDERGELSQQLKRGVLSEDALYDLLCEAEARQQ